MFHIQTAHFLWKGFLLNNLKYLIHYNKGIIALVMLISLAKWSQQVTFFVFQVLTSVRYVTVPFPVLICQLDYLMKNIGVQKGLIFVDLIIISRYFFTFHSKNPTAIQEDFWIMFLNLWAVGIKNTNAFIILVWLTGLACVCPPALLLI